MYTYTDISGSSFSPLTHRADICGIHQLSFYSHPDSFRIPAAHQQQAVLVDCQTKYLTCPRQETKAGPSRWCALGIWLLAVPCDTGTCMARAAALQKQHPGETVISATKMPRAALLSLFLRSAAVLLALCILWPASHSLPTHYFYTSGSWFSVRIIKLLKITQIKKNGCFGIHSSVVVTPDPWSN